MKTVLNTAIFILISSLFLSSCMFDECGTKDRFLEGYNSFIAEVSEKHNSFDEKDWKKKDVQFRKYIEECYDKFETKLSDREKKEVWAKSLKYYFKKYGFDLKKFLEKDDSIISQKFKDELEKLKNYSAEDFEEIFKEVFQEDLSDLIDSTIDLFKELGEELKKELQSEN